MKLDLVMPMAGRGSRFSAKGILEPKPLIDLAGRPFFWWAVESIRREAQVGQIVFVVLAEHQRDFQIGDRIRQFYEHAQVVEIDGVTSGSAETASLGIRALSDCNVVAINDCDHVFVTGPMEPTLRRLEADAEASLMCFHSQNPGFSYVELDAEGVVTGTVEKVVASPFAIAGCYLFRSPNVFNERYTRYRETCPYKELYISGIYNEILGAGGMVDLHLLEEHFPFGTPEEYAASEHSVESRMGDWR